MSWEIISARLWPEYLVEGDNPNRGWKAVEENAETQVLLEEGWEPFAAIPEQEATLFWLKREAVGV